MATRRFPIRIGRRSRVFLRVAYGVRDDNAWVDLTDDEVIAQFGRYGLRTPIGNIVHWRIEGPWRWITAIGVRTSVRHRDVSFAGSPRGGVRLDVREPLTWAFRGAPALYVGVDDLEGFAAAIAAHGIPGEDARTR
jgi:hypothetical protein